ncbi:hypothetical protein M422DRAFT_55809 [Sphaerobolus stellatus SS14]|uniref:Uncharacterized protein n=1 Tax=Sphaerobolus stellatus (strain SS14) TaxID=990650 RepID=A0A0C9U9K8_SPHS4|nr:hypothetical protein M422DRAFT_55809 [Sphaerobolus stellatus SS14]
MLRKIAKRSKPDVLTEKKQSKAIWAVTHLGLAISLVGGVRLLVFEANCSVDYLWESQQLPVSEYLLCITVYVTLEGTEGARRVMIWGLPEDEEQDSEPTSESTQ